MSGDDESVIVHSDKHFDEHIIKILCEKYFERMQTAMCNEEGGGDKQGDGDRPSQIGRKYLVVLGKAQIEEVQKHLGTNAHLLQPSPSSQQRISRQLAAIKSTSGDSPIQCWMTKGGSKEDSIETIAPTSRRTKPKRYHSMVATKRSNCSVHSHSSAPPYGRRHRSSSPGYKTHEQRSYECNVVGTYDSNNNVNTSGLSLNKSVQCEYFIVQNEKCVVRDEAIGLPLIGAGDDRTTTSFENFGDIDGRMQQMLGEKCKQKGEKQQPLATSREEGRITPAILGPFVDETICAFIDRLYYIMCYLFGKDVQPINLDEDSESDFETQIDNKLG